MTLVLYPSTFNPLNPNIATNTTNNAYSTIVAVLPGVNETRGSSSLDQFLLEKCESFQRVGVWVAVGTSVA